eukprot:SAG31_NODE_661_length_13035_cov_12.057591_4_plen_226_part_00
MYLVWSTRVLKFVCNSPTIAARHASPAARGCLLRDHPIISRAPRRHAAGGRGALCALDTELSSALVSRLTSSATRDVRRGSAAAALRPLRAAARLPSRIRRSVGHLSASKGRRPNRSCTPALARPSVRPSVCPSVRPSVRNIARDPIAPRQRAHGRCHRTQLRRRPEIASAGHGVAALEPTQLPSHELLELALRSRSDAPSHAKATARVTSARAAWALIGTIPIV